MGWMGDQMIVILRVEGKGGSGIAAGVPVSDINLPRWEIQKEG